MDIDVNNPENIKSFLRSCSNQPGVYQMLSDEQEILYIGKAKNLAKRLASYFNKTNLSLKTKCLVKQIHAINTTVTNTESEALILECNLIKQSKPKYNILLRDDKSYPYICLSKHQYPRLYLFRGKKSRDDLCFGPYPNAGAAKQTIKLLQQVFLLRTCSDSYFNNRIRPCLLYQINRCSAPCVNYIQDSDYSEYLNNSRLFLQGKSQELVSGIISRMEIAAKVEDYETAAKLRDQIKKLQAVFAQQYVVDSSNYKATDVIAFVKSSNMFAMSILQFRHGCLLGSKEYFDKILLDFSLHYNLEEILLLALSQYYLGLAESVTDNKPELDEVIINYNLTVNSKILLTEIINMVYLKEINKKINFITHPRSGKLKWLELAVKNASDLLAKKTKNTAIYENQFLQLTKDLQLEKMPSLIECFDVSHTFGDQTVASCVVYTSSGPDKTKYRKYNIKNLNNINKGNDLAAMQEVLTRRYKKMSMHNEKLPELILIDGGKAQLNIAKKVFADLNIDLKSVNIKIYGISKGEGRRAVNDKILTADLMQEVFFPPHSPARHLLQQIRDEAHRFAIMGHRVQRSKEQMHSKLEDIPGIGARRRKLLLTHFGGWHEVVNASISQLVAVKGISKTMAEMIYNYLHKGTK